MAKSLIVIESPGKIPAYKKYLGGDYEVLASYGHVVDLPAEGINVDIKNDFAPTYKVMDDKKSIVEEIITKAKKSDIVYLMSDPDREGTAIAWHLSKQFPKGTKYKRASTASITKQAITEAIANAGEIDMKMVESYEARRILDRICGYKTSFLVKQATGGRSAGRVQSAALRILAEREKEIRAFIPVEYWPVEADLLTPDKKKVTASVVKPERMTTNTEIKAKQVQTAIQSNPVLVTTCDTKNVPRNPSAPFTTSSLQATASSMFGWDQRHTMSVAQKLYEGGHITYMRTDSTHIVPDQVDAMRSVIKDGYGKDYLPDRSIAYKGGKNAQEAHEAIRPTHFEAEEVSTGDEARLYSLIRKRTIASQMTAAKYEQVRATFSAGPLVNLAASGSRQLFDGFKKCWDYREATDTFLPAMKVGDKMDLLEVRFEQKFTEPPPRYGVATFNTKLEELGIARPSTLAAVTKTLQDRDYIQTKKNTHHVTDLGLRVVDFLVNADMCFADPTFTRQMEDSLDDILDGKTGKLEVLKTFWTRLSSDIKKAEGIKAKANVTTFPCPECAKKGDKKFLVKKCSRFGEFFSCEARTDGCTYKADVGADGSPQEKVKKPKATPSGFKCPNCGADLLKRSSRFGEFLGCGSYPKCKTIANMDGTVKPPSTGGGFKKNRYKKKGQASDG